jgi:hypothetical protein
VKIFDLAVELGSSNRRRLGTSQTGWRRAEGESVTPTPVAAVPPAPTLPSRIAWTGFCNVSPTPVCAAARWGDVSCGELDARGFRGHRDRWGQPSPCMEEEDNSRRPRTVDPFKGRCVTFQKSFLILLAVSISFFFTRMTYKLYTECQSLSIVNIFL